MTPEIKERIDLIRRGEVPEGYKKSKTDIVPIEWQESPIRKYICEYTEKTTVPNQYPVLTSARTGLMLQTDYYTNRQVTTEDNVGYNVLPYGYVTFRSRSDDGHFRFNENRLISKGIISYFYPVFSFSEDVCHGYMLQLLNHSIYRRMYPYVEGTAQQVLSLKKLGQLSYAIPPIAEQQKIAAILTAQDKVIELKEKRLSEKQRQKKYLMQQLLTGKKRLPGFSGEWKSVSMSEIGSAFSGLSGKSKDDFGKGKPYIPYINIYSNYVIDMNSLEYVQISEEERQEKVKFGDIFFTTSSETPEEVGMSSVLLSNVDEVYLNSFCFGFRLHDFSVLLPEFAAQYFRGDVFRNIVNVLAQGATRYNLSKNNLLKCKLKLPRIKEQAVIAEILSVADREIDLLRQDIGQEKQKKKALMQLLLTGIVRVTV